MLELAQSQRDVLVKHGLGEQLLDDLSAALEKFDATVADTQSARRDHVSAGAQIDALPAKLAGSIVVLDGLKRYRFAGNAEELAAWESVRHVTELSGRAEQLEESGSATPAPAPTPAEGKPAA